MSRCRPGDEGHVSVAVVPVAVGHASAIVGPSGRPVAPPDGAVKDAVSFGDTVGRRIMSPSHAKGDMSSRHERNIRRQWWHVAVARWDDSAAGEWGLYEN